jgi:NADH:ubiquinone oxidoreductase subunit 2 (subunit N)
MIDVDEHYFSVAWNTSQGRILKFDILSNAYNYALVLPCFLITLLGGLHNLLYRCEERKSAYISLLIFNLIALIILITSNNFVQLTSALFIVDILALFMIKDIKAAQSYLLLNMAADMMLFTVLALIDSRVNSLDISEIMRYRQIGFHADFAALTGLTAIFAKLGFAVFQIGNMALKDIRFHRMQNVLLLSSPMAALIY